MNKKSTVYIAQGAMIAALYVALTLIFQPISFSSVQFRIAEALTIMPLFTPAAIPGLFIGCLVANFLGGAVIIDIIFGSIATLIGAVFGYFLKKNRWLVPIPAIVSNMLIIPLVLKYGYEVDVPYFIQMLYIAVGEICGCYILGELLATAIYRTGADKKIQQ